METKRTVTTSSTIVKDDANRDPKAGAVAKAGRATGESIGGAVGNAIGVGADVVVGAVAGGIAAGKHAVSKMAAPPVDPATEHAFWRKEVGNRPYFTQGTPYEQYGPAFQYGWDSRATHKGKTFNDVELQLGREWETHRGQSKLSWNHAKGATHDAWQRAEKAACGDSCS